MRGDDWSDEAVGRQRFFADIRLGQHFDAECHDNGAGHHDNHADQRDEDMISVGRVVIVFAKTNFPGMLLHTETQV